MKSFGFVLRTAVILASTVGAALASAQQPGVARGELRAQAIVASFNKSKHVVKEKRGVRKEKYLEVRSAPAERFVQEQRRQHDRDWIGPDQQHESREKRDP